jgi:hypothetical protein
MGVDLYGKHGGYVYMNWTNWEYCLETAYSYGWKPRGTVAADPAFLQDVYGPVREGFQEPDYSEWDGSYFSNDWQIVTDDDARAIAAFGAVLCVCAWDTRCGRHVNRGRLTARLITHHSNGIQQLHTVPKCCDAKLLQVLFRQARKNRLVYLILAEDRLILPEAQAPQPDHNVHDGAPTIGGGSHHLPGRRGTMNARGGDRQ